MQWTIDPSHTSVEFAVKHMGIFTVKGRFNRVSGLIETDEQGTLRRLEADIDAATIHTADQQRDAHLRSPDFLDVKRYPALTFRSAGVERLGDTRYRVAGTLTIREQARPASFEVEFTAPITDPWGKRRAGASAVGRINRKDWGLTWNQVLEMGALLVGEEVRFTIDVQAVAAAPVGASQFAGGSNGG